MERVDKPTLVGKPKEYLREFRFGRHEALVKHDGCIEVTNADGDFIHFCEPRQFALDLLELVYHCESTWVKYAIENLPYDDPDTDRKIDNAAKLDPGYDYENGVPFEYKDMQ